MDNRYLYKAKRIDNGEWVHGNCIYDGVTGKFYIHAVGNSVNETDHVGMEGCLQFVAFEIDPATICQCTGQLDKNKKLIFEGDSVRAHGNVHGVVSFGLYGDEKNDYGFFIEWEKSQPYWRNDIGFWLKNREIEVVGNKFNNPELLEVEKYE